MNLFLNRKAEPSDFFFVPVVSLFLILLFTLLNIDHTISTSIIKYVFEYSEFRRTQQYNNTSPSPVHPCHE